MAMRITPRICILSVTLFVLLHLGCAKKELQQDIKTLTPSTLNQDLPDVSKNDTSLSNAGTDTVPTVFNARKPVSSTNKYEQPLKTSGNNPPVPRGQDMSITSTYNCGASFSDSYYGSGFYSYPQSSIALQSPVGNVSVALSSYDVPNRFSIYDERGNLVASSGWMGYANYTGPWGQSLNSPQTKTLSFLKSSRSYTLRVETVTDGYSDYWGASISCSVPPTTVIFLEDYFIGYDRNIISSNDSTVSTPYMIQKNHGLINHLAAKYPSTYGTSNVDPNDSYVTWAAYIHMYAVGTGLLADSYSSYSLSTDEMPGIKGRAMFVHPQFAVSFSGLYLGIDNTFCDRRISEYLKLDWGCVLDVAIGTFDIYGLVSEYADLVRTGGSWSSVRGLLFRTARRYAGWIAAAALIYDVGTNCL